MIARINDTVRRKSSTIVKKIILIVLLAGCTQPATKSDTIVATTGMVADLVKRVAGSHFTVEALMGAGVDPHLYKPTEGDLHRLRTAGAIFYSGIHLEGKLTEVLKRVGETKPAIALGASVPVDSLLAFHDQFHDPHIWFDPLLWKLSLPEIAKQLAKLKPQYAAEFDSNAALASAQLDSLHRWICAEIDRIPPENRILVTSHDAFSYFGRRYKLRVIGLQGISTVGEYGLQDVAKMVDMLVLQRLPAVFIESSVPRRSMEAVIHGVASRGHRVVIGGELFSDAMGNENTPEGDYLGMMKHNVQVIVTALSK